MKFDCALAPTVVTGSVGGSAQDVTVGQSVNHVVQDVTFTGDTFEYVMRVAAQRSYLPSFPNNPNADIKRMYSANYPSRYADSSMELKFTATPDDNKFYLSQNRVGKGLNMIIIEPKQLLAVTRQAMALGVISLSDLIAKEKKEGE